MFDLFSWSHILILLAVALVVVGPKDLPKMMHMAGKWAGKARGLANEFKKSFDDMARQTELDELRKEIETLPIREASKRRLLRDNVIDLYKLDLPRAEALP